MGYLRGTGRDRTGGVKQDQLDWEGAEDEEPLIGVTLTHFVQGRSPLNPFPGARPRRKVPDNLQEPSNRGVIHHAAARSPTSTETSS